MSVDLRRADSLDVLPTLADGSVSAIVCDPPYGLADHEPATIVAAMTAWCSGDRDHVPSGRGFMSRDWDAFVPPPAVWDECLRVLKPGGHMAVFAAPRTMDLMGISIRLAGFEMRDAVGNALLAWVQSQGFPKSKGQLKPAWEPIIVARKPLAGTVAACVLAHGTGALNVDGCRVEGVVPRTVQGQSQNAGDLYGTDQRTLRAFEPHTAGRWPANVVLTHVGTVLYALRHDVPDAIAQTIRAYYAADEAVREVWDGVPGDAVGAGEAPVLLAGVREPRPEGRPEDRVGAGDVPAVRGDVRDLRGLGAERAPEVLLSALSGPGEPRQSEPARQGAHRGVADEDGRQPADGRAVESVEGRPVRLEGLCARPSADAASGDAGDHRADGGEERLHPGAPRGCGCDGGPCADDGRRRAPRERREDGQPSGEPCRDASGGSLDGAPRVRAEVPSVAGRGGSAAGGERRLTVPAGSVPPGWLRYFEHAGDGPDCADPCAPGCPVAELDAQSGTTRSKSGGTTTNALGVMNDDAWIARELPRTGHDDQGGASRFFPTFRYQAKAPTSERPKIDGQGWPTVKPLTLMRWLVRLVTPPGGLVLDPFAGTGTTLQAAELEGFDSLGIERDPHAYALACQRLGIEAVA